MKFRIAINEMILEDKLPQGDPLWARFNDAFRNRTVDVIELANAIYTGHAYAAWHDGRRKLENFILGQHIAVDMDTEDERSSIDELQRHPFVLSYATLLHTTPSHTDDAPRCRIVFILDEPIRSAPAYKEAIRFVTAMFPGADTASVDASRFFYGAKDCRIELPMHTLPLQHLRWYYRRYAGLLLGKRQDTPAQTREMKHHGVVPQDMETELAKVTRALQVLDPWSVDYNRWIGIIAALKREFGDAALPLAISWAQGKPGEVEREWRRLDVERPRAMHLGTIYHLATGKVQ